MAVSSVSPEIMNWVLEIVSTDDYIPYSTGQEVAVVLLPLFELANFPPATDLLHGDHQTNGFWLRSCLEVIANGSLAAENKILFFYQCCQSLPKLFSSAYAVISDLVKTIVPEMVFFQVSPLYKLIGFRSLIEEICSHCGSTIGKNSIQYIYDVQGWHIEELLNQMVNGIFKSCSNHTCTDIEGTMRITEKLIDLPDCIIFLNAETFPLHLDLSNQTEDRQDTYKLLAVILNITFGSLLYLSDSTTDTWKRIFCGKFINVNIEEVLSQKSYLCFYRRAAGAGAATTSPVPVPVANAESSSSNSAAAVPDNAMENSVAPSSVHLDETESLAAFSPAPTPVAPSSAVAPANEISGPANEDENGSPSPAVAPANGTPAAFSLAPTPVAPSPAVAPANGTSGPANEDENGSPSPAVTPANGTPGPA